MLLSSISHKFILSYFLSLLISRKNIVSFLDTELSVYVMNVSFVHVSQTLKLAVIIIPRLLLSPASIGPSPLLMMSATFRSYKPNRPLRHKALQFGECLLCQRNTHHRSDHLLSLRFTVPTNPCHLGLSALQQEVCGTVQGSRFQHFDYLWTLFSQGTDHFEDAWYHVVVAYVWNLPTFQPWRYLAPFLPTSWHPSGRISRAELRMSTIQNTAVVLQNRLARSPAFHFFLTFYKFIVTGSQFLFINSLINSRSDVMWMFCAMTFLIFMDTGKPLKSRLTFISVLRQIIWT